MTLRPPAEPAAAPLPQPAAAWEICLLGGLTVRRGTQVLTSVGSRAATALLARLALQPHREHPREELIEHLWPGVELEAGRNRLRQTLFSLRQWLEAPGADPAAAPLRADRHGLRVAPGALPCDVLRFEAAVRAGRHGEARALYTGELLPGFYDEWIEEERLRLAALFDRVEAAPPAPAAPAGPSLPTYLTRFVGRDAEGARLRAEVRSHRLVTLLGPGGSGKTRLAVELAASLAAGQAPPPAGADDPAGFDQLIFTPLVHCQDAVQLADAVRASAHLPPAAGDATAALCAALAGRRVLLVLDNAEHLAEPARALALRLLAALPGLHLLVTSRHVLGVDGEREFQVAPLALPGADVPLERLAINPAMALFADRARAARSDFQLSDANRACVVELIHALEGMPLALELAASRLRSLSCEDMLALLRGAPGEGAPAQPRLELLARAGPRAGGDPRHASMLRVVEWSWRQLAPPAARLLAALTVFQGGFTAAAAQAVCGEAAGGTHALIDELVAHSLARVVEPPAAESGSATPRRFSLYEPVREYAAAQLDGGEARALRARHRAWVTGWAASHRHGLPLAALRDELPNLQAAMASALADGAPAEALQPLLALRGGAFELALPAPVIDLAEAALHASGDALLRSRAHTLLSRLCLVVGRGDAARRHADAGLAGLAAIAESEGSSAIHPALHARALHAHASVRWRSTLDPQGLEAELDEAEALALACGDTEIEAAIHTLRAYIRHLAHHDVAGGQALNERALALWERAGDAHAVNRIRYNLAVNASHAGRHAEALARVEQVAAHARAERDVQQLSKALNVQGLAQAGLRRWPEAAASYREAIRVAWGGGELQALGFAMWNLPTALARLRRPEAAARLAGFIGHFWHTHIGPLGAADRRDLEHHRRLVTVQCGREATRAAWLRGETMSLAEAVALAGEAGKADGPGRPGAASPRRPRAASPLTRG